MINYSSYQQFNHQFLKVSDIYVVSQFPKCGCSTVTLQSLVYNLKGEITLEQFSEAENKHLLFIRDKEPFIEKGLFQVSNEFHINESNVKHYPGQKVVVIFRDPIKRFLSAYNTSVIPDNEKKPEEILNRIKTQLERGELINLHYNPQCIYYDFNDVDIFVNLENYPDFCKENNIPWIMANKNISEKYLKYIPSQELIENIKKLYEEDCELIKRIQNSDKLYKPSNL